MPISWPVKYEANRPPVTWNLRSYWSVVPASRKPKPRTSPVSSAPVTVSATLPVGRDGAVDFEIVAGGAADQVAAVIDQNVHGQAAGPREIARAAR